MTEAARTSKGRSTPRLHVAMSQEARRRENLKFHKTLYTFISPQMHATCTEHLILFDFICLMIFVRITKYH
jgi:hypothetical protein